MDHGSTIILPFFCKAKGCGNHPRWLCSPISHFSTRSVNLLDKPYPLCLLQGACFHFCSLMAACLPTPEVQSWQPWEQKPYILVALCIIAPLSGTVCFGDLYFISYFLTINSRKAFFLPNACCFCGWILGPSLSRDLPWVSNWKVPFPLLLWHIIRLLFPSVCVSQFGT